ncbi:hypothetical protein CIL05_06255 [Virgibacillus profundi]|uniref:Spore coat protein n=1 Tax=Virgibacillus profundi TaxID=2024555 RepID=A0A2A2IHT4_9BACI|nr:YppG family protein [Virgibacillus profundi]PAV30700.1 hypothetical protein CIL05_06255 [Virgibacillus profundi]PXY54872.1 hypothetical protein CIT14_06340 [Virgibacillus profundi]
MYYRPYHYPPDYHYFAANNDSQQPYNPYTPYGPPHDQTPFEQFAKPQQPMDWPADSMQSNQAFNQQPNMNGVNSFMTKYQDENGQIDLDKMLSTVGQLANTYHQVSPIVKQFGSILKNFR